MQRCRRIAAGAMQQQALDGHGIKDEGGPQRSGTEYGQPPLRRGATCRSLGRGEPSPPAAVAVFGLTFPSHLIMAISITMSAAHVQRIYSASGSVVRCNPVAEAWDVLDAVGSELRNDPTRQRALVGINVPRIEGVHELRASHPLMG